MILRVRLPNDEASSACDACAQPLPISRPMSRVIRRMFGAMHCPACNEEFSFEDALDEALTEIHSAVEDGYSERFSQRV